MTSERYRNPTRRVVQQSARARGPSIAARRIPAGARNVPGIDRQRSICGHGAGLVPVSALDYASPLPLRWSATSFRHPEQHPHPLDPPRPSRSSWPIMAFPALKSSPRRYGSRSMTGSSGAGRRLLRRLPFPLLQRELADRPGQPTTFDLVTVSVVGMALILLEATRRSLGPPLMIVVCLVFHRLRLLRVLRHHSRGDRPVEGREPRQPRHGRRYWLTTEGVYRHRARRLDLLRVPLRPLRGAAREGRARATTSSSVAFGLLGHLRGGPAKAAVRGLRP